MSCYRKTLPLVYSVISFEIIELRTRLCWNHVETVKDINDENII